MLIYLPFIYFCISFFYFELNCVLFRINWELLYYRIGLTCTIHACFLNSNVLAFALRMKSLRLKQNHKTQNYVFIKSVNSMLICISCLEIIFLWDCYVETKLFCSTLFYSSVFWFVCKYSHNSKSVRQINKSFTPINIYNICRKTHNYYYIRSVVAHIYLCILTEKRLGIATVKCY